MDQNVAPVRWGPTEKGWQLHLAGGLPDHGQWIGNMRTSIADVIAKPYGGETMVELVEGPLNK